MKPAIEYWRGKASSYGWPMDDPATGAPMNITGLTFRVRVFLDDREIILPAYGAPGRPLIDGKEIQHPAMLMIDLAAASISTDPGRYSLIFEANDGSGWQVLPIYDQSIIVR